MGAVGFESGECEDGTASEMRFGAAGDDGGDVVGVL